MIDFFAEATLQTDINSNTVAIIFNDLESAKACHEALRDEKGLVDKNNPTQPKIIHMPNDYSFIIYLTADEYDTVMGQGKFAELVRSQMQNEVVRRIEI